MFDQEPTVAKEPMEEMPFKEAASTEEMTLSPSEGLEALLVETEVEEPGDASKKKKKSMFKSFRKSSKEVHPSPRLVLTSCVLNAEDTMKAADEVESVEDKEEKEQEDQPIEEEHTQVKKEEPEEKKQEEKEPSDEVHSVQQQPKTVWKSYNDPNTGRLYYYNRLTRVTTWTPPEDISTVKDMTSVASAKARTNNGAVVRKEEDSQDSTKEASINADDSTKKTANASKHNKRKKRSIMSALRKKKETTKDNEEEESKEKAPVLNKPEEQEDEEKVVEIQDDNLIRTASYVAPENNVEIDAEGSAIAWDGEVLCTAPEEQVEEETEATELDSKKENKKNKKRRFPSFKRSFRKVGVAGQEPEAHLESQSQMKRNLETLFEEDDHDVVEGRQEVEDSVQELVSTDRS